MKDKKIKKFSKTELLEILLSQATKIEELEKELKKSQKLLLSKKIELDECGTIAEASLKLNNIFETAQKAADQYLLNVQEKCKKMENDTIKQCETIKEKMIKDTEKICERKIKKVEKDLISKSNKKKTSKKSSKNINVDDK